MFSNELRYALRAIRTWKLLSATVVLTLAIGIGSATAIFSVVDALLLNPLPYPDADRLVLIWQRVPDANVQEDWLSAGQYNDIVEQSGSFEELALVSGGRTLLNRRAPGEDVGFLLARSAFFRVMGARAHLGRVLTAEDDGDGAGAWDSSVSSQASPVPLSRSPEPNDHESVVIRPFLAPTVSHLATCPTDMGSVHRSQLF